MQNYTKVVATTPFLRSGLWTAIYTLIPYFMFTSVFFCFISVDEGICDKGLPVMEQFLAGFYFAAVTLSTVSLSFLNKNDTLP